MKVADKQVIDGLKVRKESLLRAGKTAAAAFLEAELKNLTPKPTLPDGPQSSKKALVGRREKEQ